VSVRVYVPATLALVRAYAQAGLVPAPTPAHAVTEELRAAWPDGSEEEWEYAALTEAAAAAAALVGARGRRVVLVAEAPAVAPRSGTEVRVTGDIAFSALAAIHADTDEVDLADPEADLPDLGWFGVQELADLLR
jgi:hypothetical protein